ncbi:FadR/GntR family transcriptional regulator [Promicromonospora sp. CA-289599]|uniref:FadR/GntR family transcriptional regulator n=1 Tax=Promicromonospora sp. CA-289599 TaxID=3240014 RepID=UPI003D931292
MVRQASTSTQVTRNRPALAEAVIRALVHDVVTEKYAPGTALPSAAVLCETFTVSRTVIREALTALAEKGLVAVRQGWGTVVLDRESWSLLDTMVLEAIFQRDDSLLFMDQLIGIRTVLEGLMASSAARQIDDDARAVLSRQFDALNAALDDPEKYAEEDIAFHSLVHRISGNEFARAIISSIQGKARLVAQYTGAPPTGHNELTHEEHRHIFEALLSGDADASAELMRAHISRSWARRRPKG